MTIDEKIKETQKQIMKTNSVYRKKDLYKHLKKLLKERNKNE